MASLERSEILAGLFDGESSENGVFQYIHNKIKSEKASSKVNFELVSKIYTYLLFGVSSNTSCQYMTNLKKFINDSVRINDKKRWRKYLDVIFLPQDLYKLRTDLAVEKVTFRLQNQEERYDYKIVEETINKVDELIKNNRVIDTAGAYKYARLNLLVFWCMLITGRRFVEVAKTIDIKMIDGIYMYEGLAKKRGNKDSARAFINDEEYSLLIDRLKEIREIIGSDKLRNDEINNNYARVFNRWLLDAVPELLKNKETSHVLRKIAMNRAWHKFGEGKMDKHFFCTLFLGHQIEIQAVDHYLI